MKWMWLWIAAAACQPVTPTAPPGSPTADEPATQITYAETGEDRDPEISTDGTLVYYATNSYTMNFDIYEKSTAGTTVRRVIHSPANERFPKICPSNPHRIAFCSDMDGEWNVYVVEDFTTQPDKWTLISEAGPQDMHPSWSPEGDRIAYCSTDDLESGAWIIKVRDLKTGKLEIQDGVEGLLPQWNPVPGDNRILFQRMRERDRWFGTLWTIRWERGEARELTEVTGSTEWAAINPSWSPDGKWIVFASVAKRPERRSVLGEADDIWIVRADGAHLTQVTFHPAADWMPVWGRTGDIVFVSNRRGRHTLWSVKPALPTLP